MEHNEAIRCGVLMKNRLFWHFIKLKDPFKAVDDVEVQVNIVE